MSIRFNACVLGVAGLLAGGLAGPAAAQTNLATSRVVSGLTRPVWVTHAPNDYSRIFIIEKQGRIRIAQITASGAYTLLPTSFLDIDALVTGGTSEDSEQGLLGLAFHPNYPTDPRFFVFYTSVAGSGDHTVSSYTVSANPDVANTTGNVIWTWDDPQTNHNGGWMAFGPNDDLLYIACGDGGNANDAGIGHTEPGGNSQDVSSNLMGKIHRIDVNGDAFPGDANRDYQIPPSNPFVGIAGDDEYWAYGLRNPWRNCFDRMTGDLYIADVGQANIEEINFQAASGAGTAGRNYGWRCYEGNNQFNFDSICTAFGGTFTFPIYTYTHSAGCSITGGCVYRGCSMPDFEGVYFFADYCTAFIRTLRVVGGVATAVTTRTADMAPGGGLGIASITSFGEDAFGEIYICDSTGGEVFKVLPETFVGPDCNGNLRRDNCDILAGTSLDVNTDGIPDECQEDCAVDYDNSGVADVPDIFAFLALWFANDPAADFNNSGLPVDVPDIFAFLAAWFAGC